MRQLQSLVVDLLVTAVEQIDINGSRNVLWMIPFAAQRFLDLNQLLKQTRGIAFILKFNDRIQKFSGSGFATDWFGLVNRRRKNRRLYIFEIENCLSRCAQILKSIANIRAKRHCGSHLLWSGGLRPPNEFVRHLCQTPGRFTQTPYRFTAPAHPASSTVQAVCLRSISPRVMRLTQKFHDLLRDALA